MHQVKILFYQLKLQVQMRYSYYFRTLIFCTRNCPFTSFSWTGTGTTPLSNKLKDDLPYFVGSDVAPVVKGVGTLTPFSIQ